MMAGFHPGITPYSISYNNPVLLVDYYGLGPIHDFIQKIITSVVRVFGYNTKGKILPGGGNFEIYRYRKLRSSKQSSASLPIGEAPQPKVNIPEQKPDQTPIPPSIPIPEFGGQETTFDRVIHFKGGSSSPLYDDEIEVKLQDLLLVMNADPKLLLEIIAHTGSELKEDEMVYGDDPIALSQETLVNGRVETVGKLMSVRAEAVYNFLVKNGVNPNRMQTKTGQMYSSPEGRKVTFKLLRPEE